MYKPWSISDDILLRSLSHKYSIFGIGAKLKRDIRDIYNRLKLLNITFDDSLFRPEWRYDTEEQRKQKRASY